MIGRVPKDKREYLLRSEKFDNSLWFTDGGRAQLGKSNEEVGEEEVEMGKLTFEFLTKCMVNYRCDRWRQQELKSQPMRVKGRYKENKIVPTEEEIATEKTDVWKKNMDKGSRAAATYGKTVQSKKHLEYH